MGVLKVRNEANTAWLLVGGVIDEMSAIADDDGDTRIMCEESTDEDIIRMDVAGNEVITVEHGILTLYGDGSGVMNVKQTDDLSGSYYRLSDDTGLVGALIGYGRSNVSTPGRIGLYDYINSKFILYSEDDGEVTKPNQPTFTCKVGTAQTNVTGGDVDYDAVGAFWSEYIDQGSNFSNGTFTAPVAGTYNFGISFVFDNITSGHTFGWAYLVTSNRTYTIWMGNCYAFAGALQAMCFSQGINADMDASDTAHIQCNVYYGGQTVTLSNNLKFTGCLVA